MRLSGSYVPKKWEEKPYDLIEGRMKATKATVEFAFSGDFEGIASLEYLMFYTTFDAADSHKATAEYVGLMRLVGTLKGQAGSFALTDAGAYSGGAARSTLRVVAGSGTEALSRISGGGSYRADAEGCQWELDVEL